MFIEVAERLRPYTHVAGSYVVLPRSTLRLQIFPARIVIADLSSVTPRQLAAVSLSVTGLFHGFTIQQDLEKGCVHVWGKNEKGLLRYTLQATEEGKGIHFHLDKIPENFLSISCEGEYQIAGKLKKGDSFVLGKGILPADITALTDRLSLGNHKSQDWELIKRRCNFSEIFPLWYRLGQMITSQTPPGSFGTAVLIEECKKAIDGNAPEHILSRFEQLFATGFDGLLSPCLEDHSHQGIQLPAIAQHAQGSPLQLLHHSSALIRSLFIQEGKGTIDLLPALPPEFHCGRLINVKSPCGLLSIEWTKKALRRITLHSSVTGKWQFNFHRGEKKCRLRSSSRDQGIALLNHATIDLVADQNYWFDNFTS